MPVYRGGMPPYFLFTASYIFPIKRVRQHSVAYNFILFFVSPLYQLVTLLPVARPVCKLKIVYI